MSNAVLAAVNPYESPLGDDEPNLLPVISADQTNWAPRQHITRVLATLLAISGLFFVPSPSKRRFGLATLFGLVGS